ncbi:unnamed protein product [Symbiodinium necroappetens]|uniref:Uncharacterized protein n=1 Tax=Symbiodinium necroappetens TaxID=1628268 RepID=A0A812VKS3_9DINO|nr:unnamed protein product [Symbiodinium necroappetens]
MSDDEFQIPSAPPGEGSVRTASSKRTSNARSSRASSSAAGEPKIKLCAFWACDEDCKQGRRHCSHHNRHLDNARNQVAKQKGEQAAKAFVEKCKDIDFANKQVEYMAKRSIALPMFAHQPLIDFAQWEQEFGVNKYGRNKQEMYSEWKQKVAGPWRRDNNGWKGAMRLWLPSREYEAASTSRFAKGASHEVSRGKKAPKAGDLAAFRAHAGEAGLDLTHDFFGACNREASMGDVDLELEAATGSDINSNVQQLSPSKPEASELKRKASALTLDASEDEGETDPKNAAKQKKKKSGNLASQRASLFDSLSKQLGGKVASIVAKIEDAVQAQAKEKAAPVPSTSTDITTRSLYNQTLQQSLLLAKAWNDATSIKDEVEKHNKSMEEQQKPDAVIDMTCKDTLQQQGPALAWALSTAGQSVNIERKDFLRSKEFMQSFVNLVPECELDETRLDRTRVQWRRMITAATQLETSLKKCTADVNKHVAGLAAATERNEKKRKEKEAKEAEAKHLELSKARLKQATADGSGMPAIFKLAEGDVQAIKALDGNTIPSDHDIGLPCVLKKSSHVTTWAGSAVVLQTLTNFGARYKKSPGFDDLHKLSTPFVAKAGKEPTEKLFADIMLNVKGKIVDAEAVAPQWMSTSWMMGLAPKTSFIGLCPNSAAFLRVLSYGDVEVYCMSMVDFMKGVTAAGTAAPKSTSELEEMIFHLDGAVWKAMGVKPYYHKLEKDQVLFVPMGYLLMERSGASTMNYGARKSFIMHEGHAIENYTACKSLQAKDGKNVEKMQQVLDCIAEHGK